VSDTGQLDEAFSEEHALRAGVLGLFDSVIMVWPASHRAIQSPHPRPPCLARWHSVVRRHCSTAVLRCSASSPPSVTWAGSSPKRAPVTRGPSCVAPRPRLHVGLGPDRVSVDFMVAATLPAGSNVLGLFSHSLANNKGAVTLVGANLLLVAWSRPSRPESRSRCRCRS